MGYEFNERIQSYPLKKFYADKSDPIIEQLEQASLLASPWKLASCPLAFTSVVQAFYRFGGSLIWSYFFR